MCQLHSCAVCPLHGPPASHKVHTAFYCRFHLVCPGIKFGERNFFCAWYKLKLICVLWGGGQTKWNRQYWEFRTFLPSFGRTQKCSVIESGSGYGKVVLPRMSKQPQRLWVYGVRKPKVVCLCAAMPMHGSAHCETMYNGRWTADRTHVAWVTCVEKGGQACITSYVCCPVLDNWLQKSNQIDWIIPMDGR